MLCCWFANQLQQCHSEQTPNKEKLLNLEMAVRSLTKALEKSQNALQQSQTALEQSENALRQSQNETQKRTAEAQSWEKKYNELFDNVYKMIDAMTDEST